MELEKCQNELIRSRLYIARLENEKMKRDLAVHELERKIDQLIHPELHGEILLRLFMLRIFAKMPEVKW